MTEQKTWDNIKSEPWDNDVLEENEKKEIKERRRVIHQVRTDKYLYRRAFSEVQLLNLRDLNWENGESYHFITGGGC